MADGNLTIELTTDELREVTAFAVACAEPALALFERHRPDDDRPRTAITTARAFAEGGRRIKAIRDAAWAAQRAYQETRDAGQAAASEAARAAVATASSAYLHPLAKATQVKHILGSAAHTARALELDADNDPAVGADYIAEVKALANPIVVRVLARYPAAPNGGGRAGELLRSLDGALSARA